MNKLRSLLKHRLIEPSVFRLLMLSYKHTWFSLMMVILSLIIACAGLSAVLIITAGAKQSYSESSASALLNARHEISVQQLETRQSEGISKDEYAKLRALGIAPLIAVSSLNAHLYVSNKRVTQKPAQIIGIDVLASLNQVHFSTKQGESVSANSAPSTQSLVFSEEIVLIHPRFADELGINEGERLSLKDAQLPPLMMTDLAGLGDDLIVDIATLFSLSPSQNIERLVIVQALSQRDIEAIENALPAHLKLHSVSVNQLQSTPNTTDSFYLNLLAMALLMFAVCLFIVMNACNLLIFKRFGMIKVMRQLGLGRAAILFSQAIEFFIVVAICSAVGVVIGAQLAVLASPAVRAIVEGLYQVQLAFSDTSFTSLYIKVFGISLCGIALALFAPFRALNKSLSQTTPSAESEKLNKRLGMLFVSLCAIALFIFNFTPLANYLHILLIGAACVILAGCCALIIGFPTLLRACSKLIPAQFTLTRLSVSQALALSQKTKIACCAFFIAVTSNMGMNLMVDSFRDSTQSWLSQRLAANHYLYSDDSQLNAKLPDLARQNGITLFPRFEKSASLYGQPTQIFSYPVNDTFKQAMAFYTARSDVWEGFESGQYALINQQFSIRNKLQLGDRFELSFDSENISQSLSVGGIIYDYGNPSSQVLLPISSFNPKLDPSTIFALLGTPSQIDSFSKQLSEMGVDTARQLFETEQILKGSMEIFDRTFIITDGLNLVTLLVASLSLACTIVILLDQSRAQMTLLRALGVSLWQSRMMLMQQYTVLCFIALLAATPFGILLSYILIEQINYHAFNWSYPLLINWLDIARLYAISLIIVVLIISLPIIYSSKQKLVEDLRCLD
ncbi:FtsX-like permease family protein [Ningiella sp. W23]|uniref:ABC transporter permease n=1 Tax=Ningiella sp. W23 TaxID=3023715 RepID=UPI003756ABFB